MSGEQTIEKAADVDKDVLEAAESVSEWFEGRIDWDAFWDRLDSYGFFIPDTTCPAAGKIQRHVQEFRREG